MRCERCSIFCVMLCCAYLDPIGSQIQHSEGFVGFETCYAIDEIALKMELSEIDD